MNKMIFIIIVILVITVVSFMIYNSEFNVVTLGGSNQEQQMALLKQNGIDVDAFIALGINKRRAMSDYKETLWAINSEMVLWKWTAPSVSDGNYGLVLFGKNPSDQYCYARASVGGPKVVCKNVQFESLFSQIDSKKTNLGLTSDYKVIKIYPDIKIDTEQIKAEVIAIAEKEFQKHYPDHKRSGVELILSKVVPISGSSKWLVIYDASLAQDLQVEITVDSVSKTVISFVPHME